jgi:hypothetical protein
MDWSVARRSIDSNLDEPRGDFMVRRVDGVDLRLHPQQKKNRDGRKEAIPVRGHWSQWALNGSPRRQQAALAGVRPGTLASSQGHTGGSSSTAYEGLSQADYIPNRVAIGFLNNRVETWMAMDHPRPDFREDITNTGVFPWPLWFRSQEHWARGSLDRHSDVTRFFVDWHREAAEPVFVVEYSTGWSYALFPKSAARKYPYP